MIEQIGWLRGELAKEPSGMTFQTIVSRLPELGDIPDELFVYLSSHFARWPEGIFRFARPQWVRRWCQGHEVPALRLCNAMYIHEQPSKKADGRVLAPMRRLDVSDPRVSNPENLLAYCEELRVLAAGHSNLDTRSFAWVMRAAFVPKLQVLRLQRNGLSGGTVEGLLEVMERPVLLDLRYNPIGVAGARALANSPKSESLESLMINWKDVGDEGARRLRESRYLRPSIRMMWEEVVP